MAELADALALGASARKGVQVQVLFPAPGLIAYVTEYISEQRQDHRSAAAPPAMPWPVAG